MKSNVKMIDPTATEVGFLRTELSTGLTLSRLALDARRQDKANRNRANARKAYDAVLRFMPKASLSVDETSEVNSKLQELKSQLKLLGEEV